MFDPSLVQNDLNYQYGGSMSHLAQHHHRLLELFGGFCAKRGKTKQFLLRSILNPALTKDW